MSQYGHIIQKNDSTDDLIKITLKHITKEKSSLCSLHGKKNSNQEYILHLKREKFENFPLKSLPPYS